MLGVYECVSLERRAFGAPLLAEETVVCLVSALVETQALRTRERATVVFDMRCAQFCSNRKRTTYSEMDPSPRNRSSKSQVRAGSDLAGLEDI